MRKIARAAMMAARAIKPITIPAIVPPDIGEEFGGRVRVVVVDVVEEFEEDVTVLVPVDVAVEDEDEVDVVGEA